MKIKKFTLIFSLLIRILTFDIKKESQVFRDFGKEFKYISEYFESSAKYFFFLKLLNLLMAKSLYNSL